MAKRKIGWEPPEYIEDPIFLEQETSRHGNGKKKPPLNLGPIHDVLPYSGSRNVLAMSTFSRKISEAIALPATNWRRQVYHFESEGEYTAAIDAIVLGDIHGIEVQLPEIPYACRKTGDTRAHSFDLRLTFKDGLRRLVFVRDSTSLANEFTQDQIEDIFDAIPSEMADEAVVADTGVYTRVYKGNLRRVWHATTEPDSDADEYVMDLAAKTRFWYLKDLLAKSEIDHDRAFNSVLRLVGRRVITADWYAVISEHSRIKLNA